MYPTFYTCCLSTLCLASAVCAQSIDHPPSHRVIDYNTVRSAAPKEIPFELTRWNNIAITATINDTDHVRLMFHTGAQSFVLTRETTKRCKSLTFDKSVPVESWGGRSESRFGANNSVKIQDFNWENVTIFEDKHSGRETDGKFGPEHFGDSIIEFDFKQKRLLIHDELPASASQFQKLSIRRHRGSIFVRGKLIFNGRSIENEFMIHSGYSGALILDAQWANRNGILKTLKIESESQVKDAQGAVLKTRSIVMPTVEIASSEFNDVPVAIFGGSIGGQTMSIIGGDLLKRFDLILDAKNEEIYLRRNALADQEYYKS